MLALALGWLGVAMIGLNTLRVGSFAISDGVFFAMGAVLLLKLLVGDESGLAPPDSRRSSQLVLFGTILLLTASGRTSGVNGQPGRARLRALRAPRPG